MTKEVSNNVIIIAKFEYKFPEPPPLFEEEEAEDGIFGSGMKFDNPYSKPQQSKVENTFG